MVLIKMCVIFYMMIYRPEREATYAVRFEKWFFLLRKTTIEQKSTFILAFLERYTTYVFAVLPVCIRQIRFFFVAILFRVRF